MNHYIPSWLIVSASRTSIFRKGFRMLFFPTKKAKKELDLDDFKKELSTLISEARKAGVNWRSIATALTDESDALHQWFTLTAPIY
jgi:hypothetical protein